MFPHWANWNDDAGSPALCFRALCKELLVMLDTSASNHEHTVHICQRWGVLLSLVIVTTTVWSGGNSGPPVVRGRLRKAVLSKCTSGESRRYRKNDFHSIYTRPIVMTRVSARTNFGTLEIRPCSFASSWSSRRAASTHSSGTTRPKRQYDPAMARLLHETNLARSRTRRATQRGTWH